MNCPGCHAEYLSQDNFCANCGLKLKHDGKACPACGKMLQSDDFFCIYCGEKIKDNIHDASLESAKTSMLKEKNSEVIQGGDQRKTVSEPSISFSQSTEEIILDHELLLLLSKKYEHNKISPLAAPAYAAQNPVAEKEIPFDQKWLEVIAKPAKAFYLNNLSKNAKLYQKILLTSGGTLLRWTDEEGKVSISPEESACNFIDDVEAILNSFMGDDQPFVSVLDEKQFKTLNAIKNICDLQTGMGIEAAFVRESELMSYLNSDQKIRVAIQALAGQGMVRLFDDEDPVVFMEPFGLEIMHIFEDTQQYFNILILDDHHQTVRSFNLVGRENKLYLITLPDKKNHYVVRALGKEQLRSLLNVAWMTDLTGATKRRVQPKRKLE
ncbi:MAG TPA: zinc ribbon domain-containing protein [Smithella sp.]|nr:zinc ribbon domain-containing protein [Smithella sp.]MDM7987374.1 zinc ribbon domain-containing protein [Smithella sp.]HNY49725.1 zinc ribbon domain-containing protein [Smithella sp.]HOG90841.1 zinc ribbon domain-containing protein [Smithella sp.]HOU51200.1 zinc ribbon domain-containing protein [Smithella sp.]